MYQPAAARFKSPDPLPLNGDPVLLGDSSYAYAHNDPVNWVDPSGRDPASETVARVRRHIEIDAEVAGALEKQLRNLDRVTAEELVRRRDAGAKGVDPVAVAVDTPTEVETLVLQIDEIRRKKLDTLRDSLLNQIDSAAGNPVIEVAAEQIYAFAKQSLNKTPRIRFRYTNPFGDFIVEVDPRTARLLDYHGVYFDSKEKKGLTAGDIRRQNPDRRLALEDEAGFSPTVAANDALQPFAQTAVAIDAAAGPTANRLLGGLMVLGGGVEIAAGVGLLFIPDPTLGTKVLGTVTILHGTDTVATGLLMFYTGEHFRTLTSQGISAAVSPLVGDETATIVGDLGDAAIGIVLTIGATSTRAGAILKAEGAAPSTGGAAASEGLGGAAADSRAVWSSSTGDVIVEGTSLPGRTGMAVPRRMTTAEMSALQQSHDVEFALIYELGPGKGGGGGRYMLYSGEHARVWFPPRGNQIWISHSHPSGYALRASVDDQLWLQLMQRNGSPQRYSTVVPVDSNPFRFSATQARLGGN